MHLTLPALVLLLSASTAFAQTGDEWSTFPPAQPTPATPAAGAPPPAPAPVPMAAPPRAVPSSTPAAPVSAPPTSLTADAGVDPEALPIVSQKEQNVAGTEPHSPSTLANSLVAPSNARVTVGQVGVGTLFVPSARLGPKGLVRVSVLGEYLNQSNFPMLNAQNIRSGVTFAASFQPFEWGEVFVSYGASANTNNRTSPNLIQALGDLSLGLKASRQWVKGLHAGLDARLLTFSGVGNQSIDRFAVGFRPTLLGTYDFRSLSPAVPILLTLGFGFTIDSTANLVTNQTLNAAEQFALGTYSYHRFNFGLALEVPLPVVTPFVEYALAAPLGVPSVGLFGPDGVAVPVGQAMPQTLGLGFKVTAIKDLTLLSGVNIGLSRLVGLGIPATPPWNFLLGASFAIDPFQRGETKLVETVRERRVDQKVAEAPRTARVEGVVTDAATHKPLAGVIIGTPGVPPSATDADGRFTTLEIKDPSVKLTFTREGYKSTEHEITLEAGKAAKADVALEEDAKKAIFELSATANKKAVKVAVHVKGPTELTVQTEEAPKSVEVTGGTYTVSVTTEGYLAQTKEVLVAAGGRIPMNFELVPQPKQKLVVLKGDRIEILQQVHFLSGKATILADSYNLLQQVVDVIVKSSVKRLRVDGHTDNRGDKTANQALSEARAQAVADYLVAQGVEKSRVEAAGYGDARPIAPNLTARGRELNRRVEFIVLEK